jgi:hypothetical protein
MTGAHPQVLIAGGGWRVWRFIVPALLNEGTPSDRITILRRSASATAASALRMIRAVSTLDELSGLEFHLTLNCVPAQSLVGLQTDLVRRYPQAMHFCDTPIYSDADELRQVVRLSRAPIYSLEDWPLMPNLDFFARETRRHDEDVHLDIEHFGIVGHFLSLYRSIHGGPNPFRGLRKRDACVVGEPRSGMIVTFGGPKRLALAKASLRTPTWLVEDFHEVETVAHSNSEILYRLIDSSSVRYCRGTEDISVHAVDRSILSSFEPFDDRKNVHELDKFIGLTRLFRSVLGGTDTLAYPYLSSVRDSLTARRLQCSDTSVLC